MDQELITISSAEPIGILSADKIYFFSFLSMSYFYF
jgi:hypothetical protein